MTLELSVKYLILCVMGTPINPVSLCRLGNVSNKPRPWRITLPTSSDVFEILKLKRKLLSAINFKEIRVSADKTLQQHNYFKEIISNLKSRREADETDLFIKHVNNLPIISKNDLQNIQL